MNIDDLIARLGTLSTADRDWLLEALSPTAREQLLQLTRGELRPADASGPVAASRVEASRAAARRVEASAPRTPAPLAAPETAWEQPLPAPLLARVAATPIAVLAEVLGAEPIWLTAALLRIADWPWRSQLLQRLPHVAVCLCPPLEAPGAALSEPFTRALLERILARTSDVPEPVTNKFESLVQKLAARRRRAAWHL